MTPDSFRLLRELACGEPLGPRRYAERHGLSRSAVAQQVEQLRRSGLPVEETPESAYRLAWPIELLDFEAVCRAIGGIGCELELHEAVDSTNRVLAADFVHRKAVLAEFQHAGRGRRGRSWLSPPGCGVWLSYAYRFDCGLSKLAALSLAVGIGVAESLPVPVALKWPNDLVVNGRKLGGVLVELRGAGDGPCEAVIGVGVNVRLPGCPETELPDQPWIDLFGASREPVDRSRLAGCMIAGLDSTCRRFDKAGFEAFFGRWQALDALHGVDVVVRTDGAPPVRGRACGVGRRGELCLRVDGRELRFESGEVSVRVA